MSHQRAEFPRIVDRWTEISEARIADKSLRPDCCVLASKVLLVAFTEAGFEASAEPTYTVATNRASWQWQGRPIKEWPPEAWSVGVEPGQRIDTGSYPGHLVVVVKVDGELWMVDGSSGQLSRPAKQMTIPRVLAFPIANWPDRVWVRNFDWAIQYTPAPLGKLHRVGNDWTKNWRKYAEQMRECNA
jgi:hypothetical protein